MKAQWYKKLITVAPLPLIPYMQHYSLIFSTDSANTLTYTLQELCISYISYKIFPKIK